MDMVLKYVNLSGLFSDTKSPDGSYNVYDDGQLIGSFEIERQNNEMALLLLGLDNAYQRKGYGRQIMNHIEQLAKQQGLGRIRVSMAEYSAIPFYERLGYKQVEGDYDIDMIKKLNAERADAVRNAERHA